MLAYFITGLRDAAQRILVQDPNTTPADQLYGGLNGYALITSRAVATFVQRTIGWRQPYPKPTPNLGGVWYVYYFFKNGQLLNPAGLARATDLAF